MKIGNSVKYMNESYKIMQIFLIGHSKKAYAIRNEKSEKCVLSNLCEPV